MVLEQQKKTRKIFDAMVKKFLVDILSSFYRKKASFFLQKFLLKNMKVSKFKSSKITFFFSQISQTSRTAEQKTGKNQFFFQKKFRRQL